MNSKTKILTGKTFGMLKVICMAKPAIDKKGWKRTMWTCECDCGEKKDILAASLLSGSSKSCGCKSGLPSIAITIGKKYGNWTPIEQKRKIQPNGHRRTTYLSICNTCKNKYELSASRLNKGGNFLCRKCSSHSRKKYDTYGQVTSYRMHRLYASAKKRNIKIGAGVNAKYLWKLVLRQKKTCSLTGMLLTMSKANGNGSGSASLDRIDSSKGYVKKNLQWVHKSINIMKFTHEQEAFIQLCGRVWTHNENSNS